MLLSYNQFFICHGCSVFYSDMNSVLQVWHAVSRDRKPLRKQYLEAVLPPYVAILRRWRPLLAGMFELASSDGLNPLAVEDRALAADALPLEVIKVNLFCNYNSTSSLLPHKQPCLPVHPRNRHIY